MIAAIIAWNRARVRRSLRARIIAELDWLYEMQRYINSREPALVGIVEKIDREK